MFENLKDMTNEELLAGITALETELRSRRAVEMCDCVYTHDCKGSANYHLNKYKHWAKRVTAIDKSKTNGYAFIGDFLKVQNEHMVPKNSIVVEVCDTTLTAYRITGDHEKEKITSASTKSLSSLIGKLFDLV
jgi:hypothetical protein